MRDKDFDTPGSNIFADATIHAEQVPTLLDDGAGETFEDAQPREWHSEDMVPQTPLQPEDPVPVDEDPLPEDPVCEEPAPKDPAPEAPVREEPAPKDGGPFAQPEPPSQPSGHGVELPAASQPIHVESSVEVEDSAKNAGATTTPTSNEEAASNVDAKAADAPLVPLEGAPTATPTSPPAKATSAPLSSSAMPKPAPLSANAVDRRLRRLMAPNSAGAYKLSESIRRQWEQPGSPRKRVEKLFAECDYNPDWGYACVLAYMHINSRAWHVPGRVPEAVQGHPRAGKGDRSEHSLQVLDSRGDEGAPL